VLASEQHYLAEIFLTQLMIKVPNFGPKKVPLLLVSPKLPQISFQKMLRSLGIGPGLETFAKFLRVPVLVSDNLVSEKSLGFSFGKIWSRKKVTVLVSEKLGIGKRYRFWKNWYGKKVSVSVKILVSSFSVTQMFFG